MDGVADVTSWPRANAAPCAIMPRFFVARDAIADERASLTGDVANHLARSLRAQPGERIVVVDADGVEHGLRLDTVRWDRIEATILWSRPATGEPTLSVEVIQALARDRMEDVIDAVTEAGARSIRPVITERTVSRPDRSSADRRVERWSAVAREAAQLAGRAIVPPVHSVDALDGALRALPRGTRILACLIHDSSTPIGTIPLAPDERIALCVGPEGGFGNADLRHLQDAGAELVHLGPRIVRTRLAASLALAILMSRSGDLATSPGWWPAEGIP